ncbi:MAG: hypothetical protein NTY80_04025 [candidate division SR1 bacterium]|nr:hypothetical protein [candidate division SR1 bacterium]
MKKFITILRVVLAILLTVGTIYSVYQWPGQTLVAIFVLAKAKEHWEAVWVVIVTAILSSIGGALLLWVIHFFFTGDIFIDNHSVWPVGFLFTSVYVMGLLIEEDQRKPYIWLWSQVRKFKKTAMI